MNLDPLTALLDLGDSVLNKIWPDANEKEKNLARLNELKQAGRLKEVELEVNLLLAQIGVNLQQAKHKSLFVAGARPFIMWVCGFGLAFNYIIHPTLVWVWYFLLIDKTPPEPLDMAVMIPLLMGLLGLSYNRTQEKKAGVHTDKIGVQ